MACPGQGSGEAPPQDGELPPGDGALRRAEQALSRAPDGCDATPGPEPPESLRAADAPGRAENVFGEFDEFGNVDRYAAWDGCQTKVSIRPRAERQDAWRRQSGSLGQKTGAKRKADRKGAAGRPVGVWRSGTRMGVAGVSVLGPGQAGETAPSPRNERIISSHGCRCWNLPSRPHSALTFSRIPDAPFRRLGFPPPAFRALLQLAPSLPAYQFRVKATSHLKSRATFPLPLPLGRLPSHQARLPSAPRTPPQAR
jgi:hypothetical protein